MGRITGIVKLDRFDKNFHLLEHCEQPMRSWTKGLMDLLYIMHLQNTAGATYSSTGDINKTPRAIYVPTSQGYLGNLLNANRDIGQVAAPPGYDPRLCVQMLNGPEIQGCDLGIQIGSGNTAVNSSDVRLTHRYGHGSHAVDGVDAQYDGITAGDTSALDVTTANTQMYAAPFMVKNDCRCDNVTIKIYKTLAPSSGLVVEIRSLKPGYDGATPLFVPTTTALATVTVPAASIGASPGAFVTCTFGTPVDLYAGHLYFINIWSAGVDGSNYYSWRYGGNSTYDRVWTPQLALAGSYYASTSAAWADTSAMINNWGFAFQFTVNGQSQGEFEYGGCELLNRVTANPNDAFDIRRFFYNRTASNLPVAEIGINSMYVGYINNTSQAFYSIYPFLIAHDVVGPVTVNSGQILSVTYTVQITV